VGADRVQVELDGEKAVIYRSRMNPLLGRNFEAMDPLEWLARLSDHIPNPAQHLTLFYGEYSSRVLGSGEPDEPEDQAGQEHKPRKRRGPSWGPLIAKVYQVDPLACTRCGKRMSIIAFVTEPRRDRQDPRPPRPHQPRGGEAATAGARDPPCRRARDGWGVPAGWE
jgi:hypothetical protein